jgi:hypothetical protein
MPTTEQEPANEQEPTPGQRDIQATAEFRRENKFSSVPSSSRALGRMKGSGHPLSLPRFSSSLHIPIPLSLLLVQRQILSTVWDSGPLLVPQMPGPVATQNVLFMHFPG